MTTTTTAGAGDRKQSFRVYMVKGLKRSESMLDRMVAMADKAAETVTTQTPKSGRCVTDMATRVVPVCTIVEDDT